MDALTFLFIGTGLAVYALRSWSFPASSYALRSATLRCMPLCPVRARRFFCATVLILSYKDTCAPVTVGPSGSSCLLTGAALRLPPPHALCSAKMRPSFLGRTAYHCTAPAHSALLPTMSAVGRGSLRWHSGMHRSVALPINAIPHPSILASILSYGIMAEWHEKTKKTTAHTHAHGGRKKEKCIFVVTCGRTENERKKVRKKKE